MSVDWGLPGQAQHAGLCIKRGAFGKVIVVVGSDGSSPEGDGIVCMKAVAPGEEGACRKGWV